MTLCIFFKDPSNLQKIKVKINRSLQKIRINHNMEIQNIRVSGQDSPYSVILKKNLCFHFSGVGGVLRLRAQGLESDGCNSQHLL